MSRTTIYCIDAYQLGVGGELVCSDHAVMRTAADVVRRAEYLIESAKALGVLAYEIEADHGCEIGGERRVLMRLGETPDA